MKIMAKCKECKYVVCRCGWMPVGHKRPSIVLGRVHRSLTRGRTITEVVHHAELEALAQVVGEARALCPVEFANRFPQICKKLDKLKV